MFYTLSQIKKRKVNVIYRPSSTGKFMKGISERQTIIYTDLDGTLLDHYTYSFTGAQEALAKIRVNHIPLIMCSSKTRAEIEEWRKRLDNRDPFISENGGAIFFPQRGVTPDPHVAQDRDGYRAVELGTCYPELLITFQSLKGTFGEKIRGFSDMDAHEIARLTGLPLDDAERAKRREYTEPFMFSGDEGEIECLLERVEALNLHLTRGGRFFHLLGGNDKGKAVRLVSEIYKRNVGQVRTVAVGDSYNDLSMLREADIAVLIQKPGGYYDQQVAGLPNVVLAPGVGPRGWNSSLLEIMEGHTNDYHGQFPHKR